MFGTMIAQTVDPSQHELGYVVNAMLDRAVIQAIRPIQQELQALFPDVVWIPPSDAMHITLLDWLTPGVNYEQPTEEIYETLKPACIAAIEQSLAGHHPIDLHFTKIEVYPAAIIIRATDNGSMQHIRDDFLRYFQLPPLSKRPPTIIHSTIAKFTRPVDLADIQRLIDARGIDVHQKITSFQLVRETQLFMQQYEVIQKFDF